MKGLQYLVIGLGLMVLAFWAVHDEPGPRARTPEIRLRSVAFDNRYGDAERLSVYVKTDDQPEQMVSATCDAKTCTFQLAMADGVHELLIAVDHNGQRSDPAKVTLDTRANSR